MGVSWVDSLPYSAGLLPSVRCASALLNSSLSEGQSGAIMEAMAMGVPVIVRENEGNGSLVTHGINGIMFGKPEVCTMQEWHVAGRWEAVWRVGVEW
jgi:glycosyltransferase involved in cell wall biosynthesis